MTKNKAFFRNKAVIFAALLLLFSTGCDVMVRYTFKVANDSDKDMEVQYRTLFVADSTIFIPAGGESVIYERDQTNKKVEPYFQDSIWWFESLNATADTLISNKNLKQIEHWNFSQGEGTNGIYELKLNNLDFE